jgi:hypothetical protein
VGAERASKIATLDLPNEISYAVHEIKMMVEVAFRAKGGLLGASHSRPLPRHAVFWRRKLRRQKLLAEMKGRPVRSREARPQETR